MAATSCSTHGPIGDQPHPLRYLEKYGRIRWISRPRRGFVPISRTRIHVLTRPGANGGSLQLAVGFPGGRGAETGWLSSRGVLARPRAIPPRRLFRFAEPADRRRSPRRCSSAPRLPLPRRRRDCAACERVTNFGPDHPRDSANASTATTRSRSFPRPHLTRETLMPHHCPSARRLHCALDLARTAIAPMKAIVGPNCPFFAERPARLRRGSVITVAVSHSSGSRRSSLTPVSELRLRHHAKRRPRHVRRLSSTSGAAYTRTSPSRRGRSGERRDGA